MTVESSVNSSDDLCVITIELVANRNVDQRAIPFVNISDHFVLAPM
jgi:hypothetical protein